MLIQQKYRFLFIIFLLGIILSLSYLKFFYKADFNEKIKKISEINLRIQIDFIDKEIFLAEANNISKKENNDDILKEKQRIFNILNKNKDFTLNYFGIADLNINHSIINELYLFSKDVYQNELLLEVQNKFGDLNEFKKDIEYAFKSMKYYFPEFIPPKIYIFSTGSKGNIYVSKEIVVIDLSYFLGISSKYLPSMPKYLAEAFDEKSITTQLLLLLSTFFIKQNKNDNTLLNDMIYYGKAYYFAKNLLKDISYQKLFEYKNSQIKYLKQHLSDIWEYFIQNKLLFNCNPEIKAQFIDETEYTFEFGNNSPGKLGRWIGKDIIESFVKNNKNVKMRDLMENTDSQYIFSNSRYNPN